MPFRRAPSCATGPKVLLSCSPRAGWAVQGGQSLTRRRRGSQDRSPPVRACVRGFTPLSSPGVTALPGAPPAAAGRGRFSSRYKRLRRIEPVRDGDGTPVAIDLVRRSHHAPRRPAARPRPRPRPRSRPRATIVPRRARPRPPLRTSPTAPSSSRSTRLRRLGPRVARRPTRRHPTPRRPPPGKRPRPIGQRRRRRPSGAATARTRGARPAPERVRSGEAGASAGATTRSTRSIRRTRAMRSLTRPAAPGPTAATTLPTAAATLPTTATTRRAPAATRAPIRIASSCASGSRPRG